MEHVQGLKRDVCFQVISGHVIYRLKMTNHSLPVDNAVRIMLQVITQLDEYTLSKIPLEGWCAMIRRYGFAANADNLTAAINNEDRLQSGAATPVNVVSHSLRTPTAILPLDHRPPPVFGYETLIRIGCEDDNDDQNDHLSTPESQDWADIRPSAGPYPPVDPSPKDQQTPKQLFLRGRTQASEDADSLKESGLTYDRSDRSTLRTPSLTSDASDISDSVFQSTPRPVKRPDMSTDAIDSIEFELVLEPTPRPIKRARMDMGALSGALFNVQSVRESNSGAQAFAPIIEMGDPSTYDSLGGSGDERNFEPAPTPKSGGKLVTTNVESNDQTKIESPPKHAEAGASEPNGDVDTAEAAGPDNVDQDCFHQEDNSAKEHEDDAMNDDAVEGTVAASSNNDDDTAMDIAPNNDQKEAEGSRKGDEAGEERTDVQATNNPQANHADGNTAAGQHVSENEQKSGEANPTEWQDIYAEYYSWPRDLKFYDEIKTTLYNGIRRDMLECLSQAEECGTSLWWDSLSADWRKPEDDALYFDLKAIRTAVHSAMNQGPRECSFKTMAQAIDQDEYGTNFDEVTKTVFSFDPMLVPNKKVDNSSERKEEEVVDRTKWRDVYAEYKAFPRKLGI
jgi:hypothetical protein